MHHAFHPFVASYLSLLEHNAKVNVNHTSSLLVDKNVSEMPVANPENMPHHGAYSDRSSVLHLGSVPSLHVAFEHLQEEKAQRRGVMGVDLFQQLRLRFSL